MKGRVLIVAGSDSGGGAGVQADIKTVTALGGFAATAITALTAQNTQGVDAILDVPADFVARQMRAVLSDLGADSIKTGVLGNGDVIEAVCQVLEKNAMGIPLVVDPVMAAKGGASLLDAAAVEVLKSRLLPLAAVLTPNLPEAEALTGRTVRAVGDMEAAAAALLATGAKAVLLKGGHLDGRAVTDLLITADGSRRFESPRIRSRHTHGTGCTLASGVAVGLAQGLDLGAAVARARAYVAEAIRGAPGLGGGHGPLNHGHTVKPFE